MKKINKARHHHLPNCTHKTFDHTTPDVHRQIIVSTTHVRVLFATNNSNSQPQPITKCLYRTTQPSQVEQENPAAAPAGYIISLWFFVVPPPPCFHLPRYQLPTNPNLFLSPSPEWTCWKHIRSVLSEPAKNCVSRPRPLFMRGVYQPT